MIDYLKARYRAAVAHWDSLADAERMQTRFLEEASNIVTERADDGGWTRNSALNPVKGHVGNDQQAMIRQARWFFRFDPNARAALMNAVFYTIGTSVKVSPQSKDPRVHKLWREFWNAPRNGVGGMKLRIIELVLRTFRDGECLIQYFNKDGEGKPSWKTTVRFRDPALLKTPTIEYVGTNPTAAQDGIVVDEDDPEKVKCFYFQRSAYIPNIFDKVPAEDIQHIKIFSDSDQKRGESYIQAIMDALTQYKEWQHYRVILNKVRTAVVLVRKIIGGTSADVTAIKNNLGQSPTARSGETKKRIPPAGTIINANAGVEYDFKSANIHANDAAEDGRNLKLAMAGGTNTPEYVFGDASNSNFSSTMVSESPFVKGIQYWRLLFEAHIQEMFRRVVQAAVVAGKLTAPSEDDIFAEAALEEAEEDKDKPEATKAGAQQNGADDQDKPKVGEDGKPVPKGKGADGLAAHDLKQMTEAEAFWAVDCQWPEIVHRDLDKQTASVIQQVEAGLLSEPTAAAELGHDYEEEVRKQQLVEADVEANPFKKKQIMDAEDARADAERNAEILAAKAGAKDEEDDEELKDA